MRPTTWKRSVFASNPKGVKCHACQVPLTFLGATVDHIRPKSRGGGNNPQNFRLMCKPCNGRKGCAWDGVVGCGKSPPSTRRKSDGDIYKPDPWWEKPLIKPPPAKLPGFTVAKEKVPRHCTACTPAARCRACSPMWGPASDALLILEKEMGPLGDPTRNEVHALWVQLGKVQTRIRTRLHYAASRAAMTPAKAEKEEGKE